MKLEEKAAKALMEKAGIPVPRGRICDSPEAAAKAAGEIGAVAVKAQVQAGKRGKAGGIALVEGAEEARAAAQKILGMVIGNQPVERVLVEERIDVGRELYLAILNDAESKGPLLLFSPEGGMEIEELAVQRPERLLRYRVGILQGLDRDSLGKELDKLGGVEAKEELLDLIERLYQLYLESDAELLEINPLALTSDGRLVALDGKLTLDDSSVPRQTAIVEQAEPEPLTGLEAKARDEGLRFVELDGSVGILANGAGLTMATMDAVSHYGGKPANFLEIGGDAYTKGEVALGLVLENPKVKALLVNFCGAFARTDVMTGGLLDAWEKVKPGLPVFFSIHGTGEEEAIAMVRERLGIEPYDRMDDAVQAAVAAAREGEQLEETAR